MTHRSRHISFGWEGQYKRVKRWYDRVMKIRSRVTSNPPQQEQDEKDHDDIYAFFQNCYHLRDWLRRTNTVSHTELEKFFSKHVELGICRDICNGTKHFQISKPSVDAFFSIGRQFLLRNPDRNDGIGDTTWFIKAGDSTYDIFELASKCMKLWESFLASFVFNKTNPRSSMNRVVLLLLCLLSPVLSYAEEKLEPTPEQKELATMVGIILPGMSKEEVRQTFGLLTPFEGFTVERQEAWRYDSPEKQIIFFDSQGRVERVKLLKKDQPDSQREEII